VVKITELLSMLTDIRSRSAKTAPEKRLTNSVFVCIACCIKVLEQSAIRSNNNNNKVNLYTAPKSKKSLGAAA